MTKLEKVIKELEAMQKHMLSIAGASGGISHITAQHYFGAITDALELLKEQKRENEMTPFDVLNAISSAYGGKQIFFQQNNGMIYDRYEADYVTLEEAVYRMARMVGDDGD